MGQKYTRHRHAIVARRTGRPRPPTATTFLWIRPTGTGYDYGKEHGSIRTTSACFTCCNSSWMSGTATLFLLGFCCGLVIETNFYAYQIMAYR